MPTARHSPRHHESGALDGKLHLRRLASGDAQVLTGSQHRRVGVDNLRLKKRGNHAAVTKRSTG